jgi:hypothetical protein
MTKIALGLVLLASGALGSSVAASACSSSNGGGGANCGQICTNMQTAHCSNDDNANCAARCQQQGAVATCNAQADALLGCWAGATFTCNASGESEAQACAAQADAYGACLTGGTGGGNGAGGSGTGGSGTGGSGTGGSATGGGGAGGNGGADSGASSNCSRACARADASNCPSDTPGNCASNCAELSLICPSQFEAVMACAAGPDVTYACDSNGRAKLQGCDLESQAYLTCFLSGFDGGL